MFGRQRKEPTVPSPLVAWLSEHLTFWMLGVWQCQHCVSLTGAPVLHLKLAHPDIEMPEWVSAEVEN